MASIQLGEVERVRLRNIVLLFEELLAPHFTDQLIDSIREFLIAMKREDILVKEENKATHEGSFSSFRVGDIEVTREPASSDLRSVEGVPIGALNMVYRTGRVVISTLQQYLGELKTSPEVKADMSELFDANFHNGSDDDRSKIHITNARGLVARHMRDFLLKMLRTLDPVAEIGNAIFSDDNFPYPIDRNRSLIGMAFVHEHFEEAWLMLAARSVHQIPTKELGLKLAILHNNFKDRVSPPVLSVELGAMPLSSELEVIPLSSDLPVIPFSSDLRDEPFSPRKRQSLLADRRDGPQDQHHAPN